MNGKSFFTRFILFLLLFYLVFFTTAYDRITYKTIEVEYHGIKININGAKIKMDLEPFIYDNSTYVPLKFIAEKLGKDIIWDDKTKTVDIFDKGHKRPILIEGVGQQATDIYTLKKGLVRFIIKHQGVGKFSVSLLDQEGVYVTLLASSEGKFSGSKAVRIEKSGSYIMNIQADGAWTITIE